MDQIKREPPKLRGAVDLLKAGINPIPMSPPLRTHTSLKEDVLLVLCVAAYAVVGTIALKLLQKLLIGC